MSPGCSSSNNERKQVKCFSQDRPAVVEVQHLKFDICTRKKAVCRKRAQGCAMPGNLFNVEARSDFLTSELYRSKAASALHGSEGTEFEAPLQLGNGPVTNRMAQNF